MYISGNHVKKKGYICHFLDRIGSLGGDLYSAVAVAATRRLLWPKETWFCGASLLLS